MKSTLCVGQMFHERFEPGRHSFVYPIFHLRVDIDELEAGVLHNVLQRDRFALIGLRSSDYLKNKTGGLREKVAATVFEAGYSETPARIELATMPRVLGYVFNPVNFYFCYSKSETLQTLIVEVQNTFGETHIYVLNGSEGRQFKFPKKFYVSPFFDVNGEYRLTLGDCGANALNVSVELYKDERRVFVASLSEKSRALSRLSLLGIIASMPGSILLAMVRIHLQAFIIFLKRAAFLEARNKNISGAASWSHQTVVHRALVGLLNTFRFLERFYSRNRLGIKVSDKL